MNLNDGLFLVKRHRAKEPLLFRRTFHNWLNDNWHIFEAFAEQADKAWNLGYRHYGGRRITEWLRHDTAMKQLDESFKISDHATPDMVRLYVLFHPNRLEAFKYNRADDFKDYVRACIKNGSIWNDPSGS
jgi:hypothetical protein